jgi:hypothetical protein
MRLKELMPLSKSAIRNGKVKDFFQGVNTNDQSI